MDAQLHLITSPSVTPEDDGAPWRLDGDTVAVGRRGVAMAREALRQATRRQPALDGDRHRAA